MIVDIQDLSTSFKVRVKKPVSISNDTIKNVSNIFGPDNDTLFIRTNNLRVLYKPSLDIYDNITIQVRDESPSKIQIKNIKDFEIAVYQKLEKIAQLSKKTGTSYINGDTIKLRNKSQFIHIYGSVSRARSVISDIRPHGTIRALLRVEYIWWHEHCYGIVYSLIQLLLYDKSVNTFAFEDQQIPTEIRVSSDSKMDLIEKYAKMHKLGIPSDAIIQKMRLDQIEDDFISEWQNKLNTSSNLPSQQHITLRPPPPPPPPPPPIFHSKCNTATNGLPFLKDISKGTFNLKHICLHSNSQSEKMNVHGLPFLKDISTRSYQLKPISNISKGKMLHGVPTLHDILNAKANLKHPSKLYYNFELARG
jgi:hypothetical protein